MATTSLWPIHSIGTRSTKAVVKQLVEYAENSEKTNAMQSVMGYVSKDEKVDLPLEGAKDDNEAFHMVMGHLSQEMRYVTGINCSPERAVDEMMITKNRWPERGNRLLFHGYQSFAPGEVTPDQAHRIGVRMARELWGDRFEVVVATHLDR